MLLKKLAVLFAVVGLAASSGLAAMIPLGSSGWNVSYGDDIDSVTVIEETATTIRIGIEKTISAPSGDEVPRAVIDFMNTSYNPSGVSRIIIDHEIVHNDSGMDWYYYGWELTPAGPVDFNQVDSDWVTPPFPLQTWSLDSVGAHGGSSYIAHGGTFNPSGPAPGIGGLVIDVVAGGPLVWFRFKQLPGTDNFSPEPTTLMLLGAGFGLTVLKRRKTQN